MTGTLFWRKLPPQGDQMVPEINPEINKIGTKSQLFSREGPGGHFGAFWDRKRGENELESIDKEDRKRKRRFLENSALL